MFYGEYPDFIEFVIFGKGGGWCRKMLFLHNADQVVGTRSKKNFFSKVSTMCLQLGSGTNQLDGVNKMVLIRQTSEFGHVLLRSLANRGWGLLSTISLILVIIFHNVLSQKFTILATNICQ